MTCHFIRHISFQIEIVSDKQKTAGGHRPSAVCYPKRFGFKPLNRFQKVSDRSERDETCTCGTCTCTSSSLRCSASSWMLSAFPRNLPVCFDVGIVAPFRPFVKRFFCVLSFFTKVFVRTPTAPVHYSLLIIHHSFFIGTVTDRPSLPSPAPRRDRIYPFRLPWFCWHPPVGLTQQTYWHQRKGATKMPSPA